LHKLQKTKKVAKEVIDFASFMTIYRGVMECAPLLFWLYFS